MPRKTLFKTAALPYHITGRTNNRDRFYVPMDEMWKICLGQLFNVTVAYGLRVHAFILMENHFHLLASTPYSNLGQNMNYFMRETSREANRSTNRINHVFGGRYKASLIEDAYYYFAAYRYLYQNPLRAKMCDRVEEYPFSTIRILFGQSVHTLPIYPSSFQSCDLLMGNAVKGFDWLNCRADLPADRAIALGLKKTSFALPVDRKTRRPFELPTGDIDAVLNQK